MAGNDGGDFLSLLADAANEELGNLPTSTTTATSTTTSGPRTAGLTPSNVAASSSLQVPSGSSSTATTPSVTSIPNFDFGDILSHAPPGLPPSPAFNPTNSAAAASNSNNLAWLNQALGQPPSPAQLPANATHPSPSTAAHGSSSAPNQSFTSLLMGNLDGPGGFSLDMGGLTPSSAPTPNMNTKPVVGSSSSGPVTSLLQQQQQQQQPRGPATFPGSQIPSSVSSTPTPTARLGSNPLAPSFAYGQQTQVPRPSTVAAPARPASANSGADKQLQTLLSLIPDDKKPMVYALFKQLQEKIITPEVFLSRAKELISQGPRPGGSASAPRPGQASAIPPPPTPTPGYQGGHLFQTPALPGRSGFPSADASLGSKRPIDQSSPEIQSMAKRIKSDPPSHFPSSNTPLSLPSLKPTSEAPTASQNKSNNPSTDDSESRMDVEGMMDVTSYAGVDLKEEEEDLLLAPSHPSSRNLPPSNPLGIDRSKIQNLLNPRLLKSHILTLAQPQGLTHVDDDYVAYVALATQERLKSLMEKMVRASQHRVGITHERMFSVERSKVMESMKGKGVSLSLVVTDHVKDQMDKVEKMEREAELAEKQALHPDGQGKTAAEAAAAAAAAAGLAMPPGFEEGMMLGLGEGVAGGFDGLETGAGKKKKKGKKADVSETVKTRMANTTALLAAGGKKHLKSWMLPGGGGGGASTPAGSEKKGLGGVGGGSKKKGGETAPGSAGGSGASTPTGFGSGSGTLGSSFGSENPFAALENVGFHKDDKGKLLQISRGMTVKEMCRITLKDALFVLESEKQMRKGALVWKWLGKVK
ncbi:hypothetical protein HDV05_005853 [Chytridiales sp. JEL 0842]|nr:hypothetical protein HDV05_005853 [Chytridiales sp. JEL 0842]